MKKFILFILLLSLNGCLNYQQDMVIYPDGSGNMQINYWMKFEDSTSVQMLTKIGIFDVDSIRKVFSSNFVKIINIQTYSDSSDSTIHALIKLEFKHVDSLNTISALSQSQFSLTDGAAGQKIFTQFVPPVTTGFGIDGNQFRMTYNYEIRGDIITHNANNKSGNILTWSYSLSEIGRGKTLSVTFRPYKLKETPYWIYILSGLVLIIVIFFLFRRKKS